MSTDSYSKWWIKTKAELENVQQYDVGMLKVKKIKDRSLANKLVGGLYARYSRVVQDLDACLDQMIQVQKSFTVRKLMNAAAIRLNELKEELTKLDISEYHYIDGALIELKLIPHDVEIIHPSLVYPREDAYELLWRALKRGETIYEPPPPGSEPEVEEVDGKRKKGKKPKKVKIDPLALLKATTEPPKTEEEPPAAEGEAPPPESVEAPPAEGVNEDGVPIHGDRSVDKKEAVALRKRTQRVRPKFVLPTEKELSPEEKEELLRKERFRNAITMIQAHERARQTRLYYFDSKSQGGRDLNASESMNLSKSQVQMVPVTDQVDDGDDVQEKAATIIQKSWRGYAERKYLQRREIERRLLIGMVEPSWRSHEEFDKLKKNLERRREIRYQAVRDYIKANVDEKARILRVFAPGLFEDIGDEIRQWFKDWYYTCKVFKDIPDEDEGGTILVIRGDIETPDEHFREMMKNAKGKQKKAGDAAKEKAKKAADAKKKKELEKRKRALERKAASKRRVDQYEYEPQRTDAFKTMQEGFDEYQEEWANINDADNPHNKPDMARINEQKCYEMQLEVRPKVDEVMRIELDILKEAIEKDKWLAKKKKGKFKPKKKKGKKGKKKKGKKGKKKKDPTGHRKVEDLFQELYQNGIIRSYPEVHIDEYPADFSYQNWEKRERFRDPPATLADARQAVIMNCIMPLGVEKMLRPKSVLIVGPRECNLDILANAVFNETRCVLFDLSTKNVAGKYPGKKGNKELIHLINKMSRLLAPSVIFLDNVEKTFCKKVPKDEKADEPKRVSKFLMKKIVKPITPEDRVLVLGITYAPWLAKVAKLKKAFQKVILVPRSDYGSVFAFWCKTLMVYHGIDRNFDISCLTKLTQYYPLPQIKQAIEMILTPSRIVELSYNPLKQEEMLIGLRAGTGPVEDKEWAKYVKFYNGTKLGKDNKKLQAAFSKLIDAENKKNEAARKKKK